MPVASTLPCKRQPAGRPLPLRIARPCKPGDAVFRRSAFRKICRCAAPPRRAPAAASSALDAVSSLSRASVRRGLRGPWDDALAPARPARPGSTPAGQPASCASPSSRRRLRLLDSFRRPGAPAPACKQAVGPADGSAHRHNGVRRRSWHGRIEETVRPMRLHGEWGVARVGAAALCRTNLQPRPSCGGLGLSKNASATNTLASLRAAAEAPPDGTRPRSPSRAALAGGLLASLSTFPSTPLAASACARTSMASACAPCDATVRAAQLTTSGHGRRRLSASRSGATPSLQATRLWHAA